MRKIAIFAGLLVFISGACRKDQTQPDPAFYAYDYYPLELGKYWVYQVDSSLFDPVVNGKPILQTRSLIKLTVLDTFGVGNGLLNYVLSLANFDTVNQEWKDIGLWSAARSDAEAYLDEGNRRLVKMTFPPVPGLHWDGTRYIDEQTIVYISGEPLEMYKGWDSQIVSVDQPAEINGFSYDRVLSILLANSESRIEKRYALEQYIRGVGLGYREYWILDTQLNTDDRPWDQKAQRGFILKQSLVEHN